MPTINVTHVAKEQLSIALTSANGRSAVTVFGGHEHTLRQTVIALAAGHQLDEHESPGDATVHVLTGQVHLTSGETTWVGGPGDLLVVPRDRHALAAIEDSAVLLTVAKSI